MFSFFRRARQPKPKEVIIDISRRYRHRWPNHVFSFIEEDCRHGEEGLALETLLSWLYDVEIEPTEEEKQTLVDLAAGMDMSREEILFWPEPPKRRKD